MLHLTLEDELFLGTPKQVGTHSTVFEHFAVMFEDDGETGYFMRSICVKMLNR